MEPEHRACSQLNKLFPLSDKLRDPGCPQPLPSPTRPGPPLLVVAFTCNVWWTEALCSVCIRQALPSTLNVALANCNQFYAQSLQFTLHTIQSDIAFCVRNLAQEVELLCLTLSLC